MLSLRHSHNAPVSALAGSLAEGATGRSLSHFHHKATAARGVEFEYTRACEYHIGSFNVIVTTGWASGRRILAVVAVCWKGDTHGPLVDATSEPLSGLLVEGRSYPKELYGPGRTAQAEKSTGRIRSLTRGSAQFGHAADSVEVDQTSAGAGAGARDLDGSHGW